MGVNRGPSPIITNGLVFAADPSNPNCYINGETTGKDIIQGNTLTCTNTGFSSEGQGSWDFDGTDDFVSGPTLTDLGMAATNTMTCMFWFKSDGVPVGGSDGWVGACTSTGWSNGFGFYYQTEARFFVNSYNSNYAEGTMSTSDAQVWNHYAGVYDGGAGSANIKIYINGVLGGTTDTLTANISSPTAAIQISRLQPTNNYQGDGWYTNILLYNRALTNSEILTNYNNLKGRFGL